MSQLGLIRMRTMILTASGIGKNFAYEWHIIFRICDVFLNILIFIEYYMTNRISWTNASYLFETVSMLHSSQTIMAAMMQVLSILTRSTFIKCWLKKQMIGLLWSREHEQVSGSRLKR